MVFFRIVAKARRASGIPGIILERRTERDANERKEHDEGGRLAALLLTLFCTQAMAATLKAGSKVPPYRSFNETSRTKDTLRPRSLPAAIRRR
jgi:hypothetical protein